MTMMTSFTNWQYMELIQGKSVTDHHHALIIINTNDV